MTSQAVVIGEYNVSGDILNLQISGEDLTGVMTAEIICISENYEWGEDFQVNDGVGIGIDGEDIFYGYVEDVEPYRHPEYTNLPCIKIKCINDGRDLTKQYIDEEYENKKLDDIVEDALGKITTSITYDDNPSEAPTISHTFKKEFLAFGFREMCEALNYTFYVDYDHAFHLFPVGDSDEYLDGNGGRADVDLDSVAGSLSNNIIQFRKGERRGSTVINYVELMSGYLDDHWTEGNPTAFDAGADCTVSQVDKKDESTLVRQGNTAIQVTRSSGTGAISVDLDINNGGDGRYEYTALDLSKKSVGTYLLYTYCTMDSRRFRLILTDVNGDQIIYVRGFHNLNPKSNFNFTEHMDNNEWTRIEFPYGTATPITTPGVGPYGLSSYEDGWNYYDGSTDFDWSQIYKLTWRGGGNVEQSNYFMLDGLRLPTVEVKSIAYDQTSIDVHGKRMLPKRRTDIKSQAELDIISASMLEKQKNPLQTLKLTIIGNPNIIYPGQSLDVYAPPYGIDEDTKYRIQSLQHIVSLKANAEEKEYDYITKLELIAHTVAAVTQYSTPWRHQSSLLQQLMNFNRNQQYDNAAETNEIWNTETWTTLNKISYGTSFPSDPMADQYFMLTEDYNDGENQYYGGAGGILYKYDDDLSKWVRTPMWLGRRSSDPPEGGEYVGDTYYNTSSHKTLQWTGEAWSQTSSLYLEDTPDFGSVEWPSDQLAVEARSWTGNFSLIWDDADDDPPTDWNHFKWGQKDNENSVDATIKYSDESTVDINYGQDADVADGEWFVYWDEEHKTGGDYDIQWTTNYSNASGAGKGLLAVVQVRGTATESPSIMLYNTYIPQMGIGSLVAHSIYSKHISGDWITGKYFRTSADVQWDADEGTQGVMFQELGIMGKDDAGAVQFFLDSADGKGYFAGGNIRLDSDGLNVISDSDVQFIIFRKSNGTIKGAIYKDTNDYIVIHSTDARIRMRGNTIPITDGGFSLGLDTIRWNGVYSEDVDVDERLIIPVGTDMYG